VARACTLPISRRFRSDKKEANSIERLSISRRKRPSMRILGTLTQQLKHSPSPQKNAPASTEQTHRH
jgi:hypothetical protein